MKPLKIGRSHVVLFTPDSKAIISVGKGVTRLDLETRKRVWHTHPLPRPMSVDVSPDGEKLVVKSALGRIAVIDAATGAGRREIGDEGETEGSNICFGLDGEHLIDGSWAGVLTARTSRAGHIAFQREFVDQRVRWVGLLPDGGWITLHAPLRDPTGTPAEDGFFLSWSLPLAEAPARRLPISHAGMLSAAVGPFGKRLAVLYGKGGHATVVVYALPDATVLWQRETGVSNLGPPMAFSPDGKYLAGGFGGRPTVLDAEGGGLLGRYDLVNPQSIDFSPDGRLIAIGSWTGGAVAPFEPDELRPDDYVALPKSTRRRRANGDSTSQIRWPTSVRGMFNRYIAKQLRLDPSVSDLYSDDAVVRRKRVTRAGSLRESWVEGRLYKDFLRALLPAIRAYGWGVSIESPTFTVEGKGVRVHARLRAKVLGAERQLSLLFMPEAVDEWVIVEELIGPTL